MRAAGCALGAVLALAAGGCGGDGGDGAADARRVDGLGQLDGGADARAAGPGAVLWSVTLGLTNNDHAPALAPDGTVIVHGTWGASGEGDTLVAVKDGVVLWGEPTMPRSVPAPPPSVVGGDVVVSSTTNADGERNALLHRVSLAGVPAEPIALEGAVGDGLAVGRDGTLYVPATPLHAVGGPGPAWTAPMIGTGKTGSNAAIGRSGTIYVGARGLDDHTIHAINPDGSERWATDVGGAVIDPIAIDAEERIYTTRSGGVLVVLESTGAPAWQVRLPSGQTGGGPILGPDGVVYVGTLSSSPGDISASVLYAARETTGGAGEILWGRNVGFGSITTSPALSAGGVLYVSDYCKGLHAMRVTDGEILWSVEAPGRVDDRCAPWSSPRLGPDGTVYAMTDGAARGEGALYAIAGDGTGPALSPWPQQGGDPAHHARVRGTDE